MHILITGATWFIGKALTQRLLLDGYTITIVSRNKKKSYTHFRDKVSYLERQDITREHLFWITCIINLAWAPIQTLPRNKKNKEKIYSSRIKTTKLLVKNLPESCYSFICWSAIWYYPPNNTTLYTTSFRNTHPRSFMEKLCIDRENAANKAASERTRVVTLRTGLVLWPEKLEYLLKKVTKRCWWIVLWSWKQFMPVIRREEWIDCCISIIKDTSISGPVHMVRQNITHETYIRKLAKEVHRPVWLRIPERIIRFFLWEAADLILWSWCIEPNKLFRQDNP